MFSVRDYQIITDVTFTVENLDLNIVIFLLNIDFYVLIILI